MARSSCATASFATSGRPSNWRLRYPEEEVVDQGLAAIMPGLVDLHTRLEQSVLRGVVNDAPYVQWLAEVAQKSGRMEASDWFDSAILGGLDALSSGITTVADITLTGASCTAVNKLGLRSVIYRQVGAMDKNRIDAGHAVRPEGHPALARGGRLRPRRHRHCRGAPVHQPPGHAFRYLEIRPEGGSARGPVARRQP